MVKQCPTLPILYSFQLEPSPSHRHTSLSPRTKLTVSLTNVRSISSSLSLPSVPSHAAETAAMSPSSVPGPVRPSEEAGFPIAVDQSEAAEMGKSQRRIGGQRTVGESGPEKRARMFHHGSAWVEYVRWQRREKNQELLKFGEIYTASQGWIIDS